MTLCQFFKTLRKQFFDKNLIELHSSFLHSNSFLKVLENWHSIIKLFHVDNVMLYQNIWRKTLMVHNKIARKKLRKATNSD